MEATTMASVHALVDEVLGENARDRRTCFVSVYARPPKGDRVVFECSDADVSREVKRRLPQSEGRFVQWVVLPNGSDLPELLLASHSVVDVRRAPDHAAELVTQIIYGDTVTPLKRDGDWLLVRMEDGYIAWIRSWHLTPATRADIECFLENANHVVASNIVQILEGPDGEALPVSDAVVGTPLVVESGGRRGWRGVTFADGRSGFTPSKGLRRRSRSRSVDRDGLVTTGMRFLGIPYLWGGTTPKGFDCSGLMQRVFALHGVRLPRDSDQQSRHGRLKTIGSLQDLETGDLLFFGKSEDTISHVGMYVSDGLFLHAYGRVRVGALDPQHNLFEPALARDWRLTRDVLGA